MCEKSNIKEKKKEIKEQVDFGDKVRPISLFTMYTKKRKKS